MATNSSSLAKLRAQLGEIEREIARAEQAITQERTASGIWERRAMNAIASGDDWAAKAALIKQSAHVEAAAALEPDLAVLGAIADECRLVIAAAESQIDPPS